MPGLTTSRRLSDGFREAAARCRSPHALRSLVKGAALELGFDYFALLHHSSLRPRGEKLVRLDNYPSDWAEEFVERDYASADPVHLACRRTHRAFQWSEMGRLVPLASAQRQILRRGRRFGIGTGFTVPVNIPGEPSGSCSFAVRAGRDLPLGRLSCAQLIGLFAFDAARRLYRMRDRRPVPSLSRRQVECLELLAAGKTDWEISHILGIRHETARQYVKTARAAYRAVNRTQLAVLALRDDRIRFEDLLIL